MSLIRAALDRITDCSLKAVLQNEAYKEIKPTLREATHVNPFAIDDAAADTLEQLGIITNPYSVKLHTHGAVKAIENQLLSIVGHHLPKRPVSYMFLKRSKLRFLRRDPRIQDKFLNYDIEPRDVARYPEETVLKRFVRVDTDTAYISDTLHFLRPTFLTALFEQSTQLQTLYATLVLPPEALHKMPSLEPSLYQINYNFDGYQYIPGRHGGGAYHHEFQDLVWLRIGKIHGPSTTITAQLLESLGANHLFVFRRGDFLTPRVRTFRCDEHVILPQIFHPQNRNASRPIKHTFAAQLLLYCQSISDLKLKDLFAKVRQLVKTQDLPQLQPTEVIHIANYFYFVAHLGSMNSYEDILSSSVFKRSLQPIKTRIIQIWEHIFGERKFEQLMKVLDWQTFTLSCRVTTGRSYLHSWDEPANRPKGAPFFHETDADSGESPDHQPPSTSGSQNSTTAPAPLTPTHAPNTRKPAAPTSRTPTAQAHPAQRKQYVAVNPSATAPISTQTPSPSATTPPTKESNTSKPVPQAPATPPTAPRDPLLAKSEPPPPLTPTLASSPIKSPSTSTPAQDTPLPSGNSEEPTELPSAYLEKFTLIEDYLAPDATPTRSQFTLKEVPYCFGTVTSEPRLIPTTPKATSTTSGSTDDDFPHSVETAIEWGKQMNHRSSEASTSHSTPADSTLLCFMSPPDWHIEQSNLQRVATARAPTAVLSHSENTSHTTSTPLTTPETIQTSQETTAQPLDDNFLDDEAPTEQAVPWAQWLPILNAVGFTALERQFAPDKSLIFPISDVTHLPQPTTVPGLPEELFQLLKLTQRLPVPVRMSAQRAKCFASDVKNNRTGLLTKSQPNEWKEIFSRLTEEDSITIHVAVIHGAGGSGKSQALQQYLRTLPQDQKTVSVILPTNELRLDWENKVPRASKFTFKTFERALLEPVEDLCIFDDYGKLPAGYLEAFVMAHINIECIILTGDSKQSMHHETNNQALIAHIPPAILQFQPYCRYYLNATHRNPRNLANALGVYSEAAGFTTITMSSRPMQGWPILSPSCAKKMCFSELGHVAHTYAGCQGLTAPKIQITLDNNTPLCTDQVMYTALSRAVHNIHFINTGANSREYWTKLDATPYLKTFLETLRENVVTQDCVTEVDPPEPKVKCHIAPDNAVTIIEDLVSQLPDKYARELYNKHHGFSNAVQTEDPVVQLFQHQQAKDETLLWATIEARIKIASPEANLTEFLLKKDIGDILFENYAVAMNVPEKPMPFSAELWQACREEIEKTYLAKPVSALINGSLRQSPDFHADAISLFLKSQWVKKTEKLGCLNVKPGQTIASFMQETVMLYGTMARYMRRIRDQHQPSTIFINCEKTPEDMSAFTKAGWNFQRTAYSNDFTAFDQSQDGAMLQFEVIKAKHYGVPMEIIEGYIHIKLNAKIFLGTLAIMRLSGEGPTFDANTECSIAYHHTRFHVPPQTRRLFAGDDSAQDAPAIEKNSFTAIADRLQLTSKPINYAQKPGYYADFCGWLITPHGVIKDPMKLYFSLELAVRTGKASDVAHSYALDAKFAFQLGDLLHDILTPDQFTMHQKTIRILHELKVGHLLR
nr:replicase [Nerine potexvirus 1]